MRPPCRAAGGASVRLSALIESSLAECHQDRALEHSPHRKTDGTAAVHEDMHPAASRLNRTAAGHLPPPSRPPSKFCRRTQPRQIAYHASAAHSVSRTPAGSCTHTATFMQQGHTMVNAAAMAGPLEQLLHTTPLTPSAKTNKAVHRPSLWALLPQGGGDQHTHCCTCNAATTRVLNKPTLAASAGSEQQAWQPPPSSGQ